jgi:hypothetical protein
MLNDATARVKGQRARRITPAYPHVEGVLTNGGELRETGRF